MGRGQGDLARSGGERFGLSPARAPGIDGRIGRRALRRLGLDVDVPARHYEAAYKTLFPGAEGRDYWALLRDAQLREGRIEAWEPETELDWLATELRIAAPDGRYPRWQELWWQAVGVSGLERPPRELSVAAKRYLLKRLAGSTDYPSLAVDALAEALRYEAER